MASDTLPVRVSGCVNFGGTVKVNVQQQPKTNTAFTLMTFNCSTGKATLDGIDNRSCVKQGLAYNVHSLVFDVNFDDCTRDSVPFAWLWWSLLGLFIVIVIGVVVLCLWRYKNLKKEKFIW